MLPTVQTEPSRVTMTQSTRVLLLTVRQALIMILGALEDYLGMERSITPRRKR